MKSIGLFGARTWIRERLRRMPWLRMLEALVVLRAGVVIVCVGLAATNHLPAWMQGPHYGENPCVATDQAVSDDPWGAPPGPPCERPH